MNALETPVTLRTLEFVTAWEMLDIGTPPPVIGTSIHYAMTEDARRDLHVRTMDALSRHGLARRNRLNSMWSDALRVISAPDREFYCWSSTSTGRHSAVLVAAQAEDAVRVTVDGEIVTVDSVPAKWLATSLVECLPDIDGAPIRSVAVSKDFYDNPDTTPPNPLAEPIDTKDVEYITEVMRRPRDAVHQLYTATRNSDGERVRSSPISALDLSGQGRVLTYVTGDGNIVLTSGTPREVIVALNDTIAGLSG